MNHSEQTYLLDLCKKEGWGCREKKVLTRYDDPFEIVVDDSVFPIAHPFQIHLTLYRRSIDPDQRYFHLKAAHDYLWPEFAKTWNDWDEDRFRVHCGDYKYITMAGGASCAKSHGAARIALLFWLSDPRQNACIIASTTLEALESRIWGYVAKFHREAALPIEGKILTGKPPKILPWGAVDKIHGMFAVAIKAGDSDTVLAGVIGRHPDKRLLIVLDEGTDMNPRVTDAFPNLEKGVIFFQNIVIGNSKSKSDLHGAMSTPKNGWDSIDPMRDKIWETTYERGVCLYFNPFKSPAITEKDPVKRALLRLFLPTMEMIESEAENRGKNSEGFWRFVMGFWKESGIESTIVSEPFLLEHIVHKRAEWTGFYPLDIVAGLDPAFSSNGDACILRLAILGHTTDGNRICMDFRGEELIFKIKTDVHDPKSVELQLAEKIVKILRDHNCPLRNVVMDATGAGRALGGLLEVVYGGNQKVIRVVSNSRAAGLKAKKDDPSILVTTPSNMWFQLKEFIQQRQIRGLDRATIYQLCSRLVIVKNGKTELESKGDYKSRMTSINSKLGHSPDEADSANLAVQAAMINYGFRPGQVRDAPTAMVDDFFFRKMHTFERERMKDIPGIFDKPAQPARPLLLPNFHGSIEDIPKRRY